MFDFYHQVRPRLCKLTRKETGYGFNLHSEKGKVGRYIRSIDPQSAAEEAGLKAGDRIIEVATTQIFYLDWIWKIWDILLLGS